MKRFDLVVFDLDGTLVDSSGDICAAVNATLTQLGLPARSLEEVRRFVGDGVRHLLALALGDARSRIDEALPLYRAYYAAHLVTRTQPYPGIAELLPRIEQPLALATNKAHALATGLLDAFGWSPRFACVIGGDTLPVQKPDAGVLLEVCRRTGTTPARALMVGDGPQDLGAARAAGTAFCGVTWGFRSDELASLRPEHLVDSAEALRRVIEC